MTTATSTRMSISPGNTGLWKIQQNDDVARCTGKLLEDDLSMLHHILALYGTGAKASVVEWAFALRHELQRPVEPRHPDVISRLHQSWDHAADYLGNDDHYPDFLAYFQDVINDRGYEQVVRDYLLKHTAASDDLLVRLHAGVVHSLIQLMYGLEWKQPAIVAEALAQTCVHGLEGLNHLLLPSEHHDTQSPGEKPRMKAILDLYRDIAADQNFDGAAFLSDQSKIEDGILQRAKEPMLSILEQVHVADDELEERTAEMFHTIVLVGSSAAIHPPYHVKYDFFLMHHINSALMHVTNLEQSWLTRPEKRRLLEYKIRMDLIQYVARGRPPINIDGIHSYQPKIPSDSSVREIGKRLQEFGDDGHGIKQARATAICHELMNKWESKPWAILKGDDIWKKIQHMVVDSLEVSGPLYVRSAGFHEAWKDMPHESAPRQSEAELKSLQTGSGASAIALASTG
ncbi:hypothetical protein F5883DRAFT_677294 [Diaporthe sp. PMI_573]|nr:hypothetical protein F5883DRAFT_677294 [Diaporthaceae sp. PMI_573]